MAPTVPASPAVDAAMSTAASLLGMEVVFLGGLTDDTFTLHRVHATGAWPGVEEGRSADRSDSFCHRMLEGAPPSTADAANDPAYADAPIREDLGICSYVGVPVRDAEGQVIATLCGIDRGSVPVDDRTLEVLNHLAEVIAAQLGPLMAEGVVIRRSPEGGWTVGDAEQTGDLTSAMVLADLLADDLTPGARPPRHEGELDEVGQLRLSVKQLEHALAARVVVEQAIGVLTERQRSSPRDAFERLRKTARSRGRKVHELAREVVLSSTDPGVPLPPELAPRRRDPAR
ncbi:MAG TPA: GAF and ANTAR domain-containing protein [Mycobacteriales bacterium]|nr:GAF and ANTAR domain-containing protein [Mycobacteriales bacterium]